MTLNSLSVALEVCCNELASVLEGHFVADGDDTCPVIVISVLRRIVKPLSWDIGEDVGLIDNAVIDPAPSGKNIVSSDYIVLSPWTS